MCFIYFINNVTRNIEFVIFYSFNYDLRLRGYLMPHEDSRYNESYHSSNVQYDNEWMIGIVIALNIMINT